MAGPKQKFFGSLSFDGLKEAGKIEGKVTTHEKYGKQLKIQAAQWDDDGISISVYNPETQESIKVGNLRVSTFNNNDSKPQDAAPVAKEAEGDLPF